MSAVAAVVMKQGAILLSDGLTVKIPAGDEHKAGETLDYDNWEIHDTRSSKIIQINSRVGITWTGARHEVIQQAFKKECTDQGLTEPNEVANLLSEMLIGRLGSDAHRLAGTPSNVNISVIGYDRSGNAWGHDITCRKDNPLLPRKARLAKKGEESIAAQLPFVDAGRSEFVQHLLNYKHLPSVEEQAIKAFTEMIRHENKGSMVGGKIFSIRLRPDE